MEIHCRLGHPSLHNLQLMVPSLSDLQKLEPCQLGKHHRSTFVHRVVSRVLHPFALVHTDVWGPSPVPLKLGFRYFITFVDDYSHLTWLYLMKDRS